MVCHGKNSHAFILQKINCFHFAFIPPLYRIICLRYMKNNMSSNSIEMNCNIDLICFSFITVYIIKEIYMFLQILTLRDFLRKTGSI